MNGPNGAPSRKILLVEPHFMMRRTVVMVARQLNLARVQEATSHEVARRLMEEESFDGMLAAIGDELTGIALVQHIRQGGTNCASDMPIALMADSCDPGTIGMFKVLDVRRIMLKPFKVKTVMEVLSSIAGVPLPD